MKTNKARVYRPEMQDENGHTIYYDEALIATGALEELEALALKTSYSLREREGYDIKPGNIAAYGGDGLDFVDMSVISLQRMLAAAYELGRSRGAAEATKSAPA